MTEEQKNSLFKDEYLHIQKSIVDLDGRMINIKTWSISFSGTAITGAFIVHSNSVLWVSILSALSFWIIESIWKQFQYCFYGRSGLIESYFRGENKKAIPLQIDTYWYNNFSNNKLKIIKTMFKPHVALPHIFMISLASILLILIESGNIKI